MEFLSRQTVRLPRWAIFVSPGRIHLTGRHVGDIAAERDGDVPGRGGGPAEMDGDVLRDDDPVEHAGNASRSGSGAAAAIPRKEGMGRDDDGRVRHIAVLLGFGDHLRLGQRHLPRKDLDALNADGPEARFGRGQAAHRIGAAGGVLRLQREGTIRCGDDHIGGIALGVGRPDSGETVPRDVHRHPLHRGGLPGCKCLNAQNSGCHNKNSFAEMFTWFTHSVFGTEWEGAKERSLVKKSKVCYDKSNKRKQVIR